MNKMKLLEDQVYAAPTKEKFAAKFKSESKIYKLLMKVFKATTKDKVFLNSYP